MFHHFHSPSHPNRPGSLSALDFEFILEGLASRFSVVSPEEFHDLLAKPSRSDSVVMLTFDDSLKSQFDVALPVLRDRGIKAGFAIYSSIYTGDPNSLEIFAAFRQEYFLDSVDFWNAFKEAVARKFETVEAEAEVGVERGFLREYPFYSHEERLFRFVRDEILSVNQYQDVMWDLVRAEPEFDLSVLEDRLWMNETDLRTLVSEGHSIGLHSHTHPTRMDLLPRREQFQEYSKNYKWITDRLSVRPDFVAHPCGRYSDETMQVMESLGIRYGFRSSMAELTDSLPYKIPREDSSNLFRALAEIQRRPPESQVRS